MIPLMPSPGSPNTVSTPHSMRRSTRSSEAIFFMAGVPRGRQGTGASLLRVIPPSLAANLASLLGGRDVRVEPEEVRRVVLRLDVDQTRPLRGAVGAGALRLG